MNWKNRTAIVATGAILLTGLGVAAIANALSTPASSDDGARVEDSSPVTSLSPNDDLSDDNGGDRPDGVSDDGPNDDLFDDNGGDRPDGVSDDGPNHDLFDDNGGDRDRGDDDSGHGSGSDD